VNTHTRRDACKEPSAGKSPQPHVARHSADKDKRTSGIRTSAAQRVSHAKHAGTMLKKKTSPRREKYRGEDPDDESKVIDHDPNQGHSQRGTFTAAITIKRTVAHESGQSRLASGIASRNTGYHQRMCPLSRGGPVLLLRCGIDESIQRARRDKNSNSKARQQRHTGRSPRKRITIHTGTHSPRIGKRPRQK